MSIGKKRNQTNELNIDPTKIGGSMQPRYDWYCSDNVKCHLNPKERVLSVPTSTQTL